ncbi:MAG: hypothetical protein GY702_01075, partial [Desulfobulbaceae bacterium]|nr:hypothetical protein [Desulfobulbaceae bacterium]
MKKLALIYLTIATFLLNAAIVYSAGWSESAGVILHFLLTSNDSSPKGYSVSIDQASIDSGNETGLSFTFSSAEVSATYNFSIDDTNGSTSPVTGNGTISSATQQITNINVSSLDDDTLTLTVYLTDVNGNQGEDVTDTITKDSAAPTGYSVSIDQTIINSTNETDLSFTFSSAEVSATYNYSIDDTNGSTSPVTGNGTISSATQQITNVNVSSLDDDPLTLTVYLADANGNLGGDVTDSVTKEVTAPTGYSVSIDQTIINSTNETGLSFTFASAEVSAAYNYSIDDTNGSTSPVTGTGTVSSSTQQITNINVSSLDDDTLTLTVYLADANGNQGEDVTDTITKEVTAPIGYSVSIDQAIINSTNETGLSFTFASAEVGAAYNYSIDDTNGGTSAVTSSGTISSATDKITGINVSSLDDDTLTLTVYLTDTNGNQGGNVTDTVTKDATSPTGYSISFDQGTINNTNETALSFTFASAEVGAAYNYSIDDTNGGTNVVTSSGTISTATDQITGINVSSLDDDTLTLTVYLTDTNGNQGGNVTDTVAKDATVPTGYS